MPTCDQVARELSDAMDRDVPFWRRVRIRLHLSMYKACRRLEASLARTADVLHDLRDAPPPSESDGSGNDPREP